jgi:hypothetical protein
MPLGRRFRPADGFHVHRPRKGRIMILAKGHYRGQKLELEKPLDIPEGTEVEVAIQCSEEEEKAAWVELGMQRLAEEWDNPQDAIYDDWRTLYGVPSR